MGRDRGRRSEGTRLGFGGLAGEFAVLACFLLIALLCVEAGEALGDCVTETFDQNTGIWTEYDPNGRITQDYTSDHRLEFDNWIRTDPGYVATSFSAEDFILEFDVRITASGGNANTIGPGVGDTLGTKDQVQNGIFVVYYAGFPTVSPRIWIETRLNGTSEWPSGGNPPQPNAIDISVGTTYYIRLEKIGSTLTLGVFSDSGRTAHVSGSPKSVTTSISTTFEYFYAVTGYVHDPAGNWEWTTGWVDNLGICTWDGETPGGCITETFVEDDGAWAEYDPNGKITQDYTGDHRLEFNNWIRTDPGYVAAPFSADDFILEFDARITASGGNANYVGPGVSDVLGTRDQIQNGIYVCYYRGFGSALYIFTHVNGGYEWSIGGNLPQPNAISISEGTTYYVRLGKSDDSLTLSVFSDSGRTVHVSGSPKSVTTSISSSFEYFYAVSSWANAPGSDNYEWTTGWIDNLSVCRGGVAHDPIADAGPDQSVSDGATVHLDGSGSSDPDGDSLTYTWSFLSTPCNSTASLSNTHAVKPTFTADEEGTYRLQLEVGDGNGGTDTDEVLVNAGGLMGYWQFEGDLEDCSGNERDGTVSIGAPTYVPAANGQGIRLTNDRADIPWAHDDWDAFTVEVCFYLQNMTTGCGQCTESDGCNIWMDEELNGPGTYSHVDVGLYGYRPGTDDFVGLSFTCDDGDSGTINGVNYAGGVPQYEWHHLVLTSVKGGENRAYYDGQLVGTWAQAGWGTPGATLYLGGREFRDNNLLTDGILDGLRLYNRALDPSEFHSCGSAPLQVSFTYAPSCAAAGTGLTFTDTSSGDAPMKAWSWSFGDGQTSTQQNPTHSYAPSGTFTVTLQATGRSGATGTASKEITVYALGDLTGDGKVNVADVLLLYRAINGLLTLTPCQRAQADIDQDGDVDLDDGVALVHLITGQ